MHLVIEVDGTRREVELAQAAEAATLADLVEHACHVPLSADVPVAAGARKALIEREVLLRSAPHIMWPLRFVMPHAKGLRPGWMIRAGLLMYDRLGGKTTLPRSKGIDLLRTPYGAGLKTEFHKGYIYSDAWVDDARLTLANALDAAAHGADGQVFPLQLACTAAGARRVLEAAGPDLGAGASVRRLLAPLGAVRVVLPAATLQDVDTPSDLDRIGEGPAA